MGGRFSKRAKAPASATEAIRLVLTLAEGGPRPARAPGGARAAAGELWVEESFSPNKAVHLVLLTTDKAAQSSELGHTVGDWMGTPRACAREVAALAAEQEAQAAAAARPRSPIARLLAGAGPRSPSAH